MSGMRQKVSDIFLSLKHDRKVQVLSVLGLFVLIWFVSELGKPANRVAAKKVTDTTARISDNEAITDLTTALNTKISGIEDAVKMQGEQIGAIGQAQKNQETTTAELFGKLLDRLAAVEAQRSGPESLGPVDVQNEEIPKEAENTLGEFGDLKEVKLAPPPQPAKKIAIIGAGDSVRVKLIAGVNAPTDGTPYPTLFKLIDDVNGPDGSTLPIGEARVIAAAQGSLTDQRALFRITKLNVRFPNGSRYVTDVEGWIVGEDGIRGMEGVLVDPFGKVLIGALTAGTISGFGQGLSQSQISTSTGRNGSFSALSGDATKYAAGQGVDQAGQAWSRLIEERAKLMIPHVKVLSGREATAIFSQNVYIEGLYDVLEDQQPSLQFASLD